VQASLPIKSASYSAERRAAQELTPNPFAW
jgi:hypothetical protein